MTTPYTDIISKLGEQELEGRPESPDVSPTLRDTLEVREVFDALRFACLHDFNIGGYDSGEVQDLTPLLQRASRMIGRELLPRTPPANSGEPQ